MVNQGQIIELFEKLGLKSEEERQKILAQGVAPLKEKREKMLFVETDNISRSVGESKLDARLE